MADEETEYKAEYLDKAEDDEPEVCSGEDLLSSHRGEVEANAACNSDAHRGVEVGHAGLNVGTQHGGSTPFKVLSLTSRVFHWG